MASQLSPSGSGTHDAPSSLPAFSHHQQRFIACLSHGLELKSPFAVLSGLLLQMGRKGYNRVASALETNLPLGDRKGYQRDWAVLGFTMHFKGRKGYNRVGPSLETLVHPEGRMGYNRVAAVSHDSKLSRSHRAT